MQSILIGSEPGLTFDRKSIKRVVSDQLVRALPGQEVEISVLIVKEESIRELNRNYRSKDAPTTVLEFSQIEKKAAGDQFISSPKGKLYLGDLVLCPSQAEKLAQKEGVSLAAEIERLLIHGIDNLLRAAGLGGSKSSV